MPKMIKKSPLIREISKGDDNAMEAAVEILDQKTNKLLFKGR